MLLSILSIIANAAFIIILNLSIYTDRAMMADGQMREWHRSAISRLYVADQPWLLHLQLAFMAVSMITAILMIFGVRGDAIRLVWIISSIASLIMFIVIMIVTSNIHVHYA